MKGIVIYLVAAFGLGLVKCDCDEQHIADCSGAFTRHAQSLMSGAVTGEQELNNVCNAHFPNLKTCLKGHTEDCTGDKKQLVGGLIKLFDYLCGDGKEAAIENGECLSQENVQMALGKCQQSEGGGSCDEVEDMLNCIQKGATDECGQEAGKFLRGFLFRANAPAAEAKGCDMDQLAGADRVMVGWTVGLALILQLFVVYFFS